MIITFCLSGSPDVAAAYAGRSTRIVMVLFAIFFEFRSW